MQTPLIVVTGSPDWWPEAQHAAEVLGYGIERYDERAGYISRLVQDHAGLVLADGTDESWRFWVTAPKVRAATRRIPVILVAEGSSFQWLNPLPDVCRGVDIARQCADANRLREALVAHRQAAHRA